MERCSAQEISQKNQRIKTMKNKFSEEDPLFNLGRKMQEERTHETFRQTQQWAQMERAIQRRLAGFLVVRVPILLWRYCRISFLLFAGPAALYLFSMIGVGFGVRGFARDLWSAIIGLIFFALFPLAGMIISIIYAYRHTFGIRKVIAVVQLATVSLFVSIATWRALQTPFGRAPYEPRTLEAGLGVALMTLLFGICLIADLIHIFINRQEQE
jgi:ABC-type glycerol-3-phosphate transport system permease component